MQRTAIVAIIGLGMGTVPGGCTRDDRAFRAAPSAPPAPVAARPQLEGLGTAEHPVIVRLVGRREVVTVSAGRDGPVYSVADEQGRIMLSHATLDELRDRHPDVYRQIRTLVATDASAAIGGASAPSGSGEAIMQREPPLPWAGDAAR